MIGSHRDVNGNFDFSISLWSANTSEKFLSKAQCFTDKVEKDFDRVKFEKD